MSLNIKINTYKISKLVKSSSGDKIRQVENKRRLAKKKNGGPGKWEIRGQTWKNNNW